RAVRGQRPEVVQDHLVLVGIEGEEVRDLVFGASAPQLGAGQVHDAAEAGMAVRIGAPPVVLERVVAMIDAQAVGRRQPPRHRGLAGAGRAAQPEDVVQVRTRILRHSRMWSILLQRTSRARPMHPTDLRDPCLSLAAGRLGPFRRGGATPGPRTSPEFRVAPDAPPRWVVAEGLPASSLPPPRRVLVHQSRFRVGDALWLTPLLRHLRRAFPAVEVTVVCGPLGAPVLSRNPHVSELLVWDPAGGEEERQRILAALAESRFAAALFALVRRDKSRWLAEAAAAAGVPWRINLEYLDPDAPEDEGGRAAGGPFTHEVWLVWGHLASPRLLLHALSPWLGEGAWQEDRRVELPVSGEERAEAARVLAELGIGDGPFTVLAPAGHSSDRWPPERFAALGVRLSAEWGHFLLIEGAPSDEPLLREV